MPTQLCSFILTPPTRRLLAFGVMALMASMTFYVFSLAVVAGSISVRPPLQQLSLAATFAALSIYFSIRLPSAAGVTFCIVMLASLMGTSFATEAGYGVHFIGRGFPLVDPVFARIDQALGFHPRLLLDWADAHPNAALWLRTSYLDCGYQAFLAIALLMAARQYERLLIFTGANFASLLIVHISALVMPAVGAYTFYNFSLADHPHIRLAASDTASDVFSLRSADHLSIPTDHLAGLVTFPSYHMVTACLFAWLFWRTPLRWPALIFNLSVAIAALIDGCHYLTDLIAGALLTISCVTVICWMARAADKYHASKAAAASLRDPACNPHPAARPQLA